MAPGGIFWFDDAPCLTGAAKAVLEFFPESELELIEGKWTVTVAGGGRRDDLE